jgi:hypothetical protein
VKLSEKQWGPGRGRARTDALRRGSNIFIENQSPTTDLQASEVFSATQHTGGRSRANHARSRANHARSHPNTRARRHILAAKPRARHIPPAVLCRQGPAPRRLVVRYKPGLHRPAVPRTPAVPPGLRTRAQASQQRHRPRLRPR